VPLARRPRLTVALAICATVAALVSAPASARAASHTHGVTRAQAVKRAKVWVKRRVTYSRTACYQGYRRDCSGMVSMAWKLPKSYTTETITARATRVAVSKLQPGDAVLTDGHITLFECWKSKRARTYYALEQYSEGKPARRTVKVVPCGAKGLRLRGIKSPSPKAPAQTASAVLPIATPSLVGP
jgi:hypothetical protein